MLLIERPQKPENSKSNGCAFVAYRSTISVHTGEWLRVNGEAIYGTRPWAVAQKESTSGVFYTKNSKTLYAILTIWPSQNVLELAYPEPTEHTQIQFVGLEQAAGPTTTTQQGYGNLQWEGQIELGEIVAASTTRNDRELPATGMRVLLPSLTPDKIPCQHAWVIRITGLANV